jgi:hypothetical protein
MVSSAAILFSAPITSGLGGIAIVFIFQLLFCASSPFGMPQALEDDERIKSDVP